MVITVISYCTKELTNSKTKQKPITTIHNKSIKRRAFNLTEESKFLRHLILRFFFLRELIFADRGQSAKFTKIRTCKIFMLHGSTCAKVLPKRFYSHTCTKAIKCCPQTQSYRVYVE